MRYIIKEKGCSVQLGRQAKHAKNISFLKTKEDDASVSVTKRMVAPAAVERLYKQ